MGLQKKLNKWFIKKAIGSEYVYQIEADEKIRRGIVSDEEWKDNSLRWFLKDWVNEIKKEVKKKLN